MRQQQVSVRTFALNVGWGALFLTIVALCAANCTSGGAAEQDSGTPNADVTTIGPCGPGVNAMCNGTCVDINSDYQNCGKCGNVCPNDQVCSHGTCAVVCGGGSVRCVNNCVDLGTDPQNCGGCSKACASGQVCKNSACAISFQDGLTNCNGGCVDLTSDDFNCNTCGNACAPGSQCVNSTCQATCQSGWSSCGDGEGGTTCVDTTDDPNNCGGCGAKCPTGYFCSPGADGGPACGLTCAGGTSLCNNACVDENIDPNNCGGCNTACGTGNTCSNTHCCPNATPFYCGGCDTFANCVTKDVGHITAGDEHTCAITPTGVLKCWGYNGEGQVGTGSPTAYYATPQMIMNGVAGVGAGEYHTCAVTTGGAIDCWGYNVYGQIGVGNQNSPIYSPTATSITTTGAVAAGSGYYATCYLLKSGAVDCAGYNGEDEIGNGLNNSLEYTSPTATLLTSGITTIGGGSDGDAFCAVTSAGALKCWGDMGYSLGDGSTFASSTPITVPGISNALVVATNEDNVCVVLTGGALKCWGYNGYGQVGDGTTSTTDTPVTTTLYKRHGGIRRCRAHVRGDRQRRRQVHRIQLLWPTRKRRIRHLQRDDDLANRNRKRRCRCRMWWRASVRAHGKRPSLLLGRRLRRASGQRDDRDCRGNAHVGQRVLISEFDVAARLGH